MPLQEKLHAKKDEWHEINAGKAMRILGTGINGLDINEVKKRLEEYGPNELRKEKRRSPILIFFGQFKEFLIILLIVASIISALVGEILDATVIIAIVLASAILGFFQEFKAEKSLEALKGMASPKANVIRDGEEIEVDTFDAKVILGRHYSGGHYTLISKFVQSILNNTDLPVTAQDGREVIAVFEQIISQISCKLQETD